MFISKLFISNSNCSLALAIANCSFIAKERSAKSYNEKDAENTTIGAFGLYVYFFIYRVTGYQIESVHARVFTEH